MSKLTVILQDELLGLTDPQGGIEAAGWPVERFSAREDWRARLLSLDATLADRSARLVLFCSLDAARFVMRRCPWLRRGLLLDPEKLRVHRWSGHLPQEMLLNRSYILLPFGAIEARRAQIEALFGPRIFLRPDSSMKPFPGLALDLDALSFELSALRQTHRVDADELCVIDRAQSLPVHEYRFWIADGRPICSAAYAFGPGGVHPDHPAPPCPAAVTALAQEAARRLEMWENPVVADFIVDVTGRARLVEINGFSTSGFYPGIDMTAVLHAMDAIFGD